MVLKGKVGGELHLRDSEGRPDSHMESCIYQMESEVLAQNGFPGWGFRRLQPQGGAWGQTKSPREKISRENSRRQGFGFVKGMEEIRNTLTPHSTMLSKGRWGEAKTLRTQT